MWYGTADETENAQILVGTDSKPVELTDTAAAITGLTNGTTYYVWVKAKNSAGTSGFSPSASAAPGADIVDPANPGGGQPPPPATADISLYETGTDSSHSEFPPSSWVGLGTAAQAVTLNAQESAKVYFAAAKGAAQTITVGGDAAALVTQAAAGETLDGSTASETESVFAVDTSAFDLMFEGGTRVFTLKVEEAEKSPLTVTVTLNTMPELSAGISVFKVNRVKADGTQAKHDDLAENASPAESEAWARAGTLTRISGIQNWVLPRTTYNAIGNWQEDSRADNLLSAIAWIDHNADENEEYLIRVQKDEQIPCIYFYHSGKENIKYRLRGIGTERNISHENMFTTSGTIRPYVYKHTNYGTVDSAIKMALFRTGKNVANGTPVVLSLEDKITIQGGIQTSDNFRYLIYVTGNSALIMEKGSKITGFDASSTPSVSRCVYFTYAATNTTRFFMRGGTITDSLIYSSSVVIFASSPVEGWKFIKTGGVIAGNTKSDGSSGNIVSYLESATSGSCVISEGLDDPAVTWQMPPLPPGPAY